MGKSRAARKTLADDIRKAREYLLGRLQDSFSTTGNAITSIFWSIVGLVATALGFVIVVYPLQSPAFKELGLQAAGPLLGIALIVFSLFGDLPKWIGWTQKIGIRLTPGIMLGTFILLVLHAHPAGTTESSIEAFSPRVWGAYFSIVLVSISFEVSGYPSRIYRMVKSRFASTFIIVPAYIIVIGLAGNILDGVTIIAISAVIFFRLLDQGWALKASFALLFGGLISNLITVAAEPTNIKFQDALYPLLDRVDPSYWIMNWPISVIGIVVPAVWLGRELRRNAVGWRAATGPLKAPAPRPPEAEDGEIEVDLSRRRRDAWDLLLSTLALLFLAGGIVAHSMIHIQEVESRVAAYVPPFLLQGLWLLLLPAGIVAFLHLVSQDHFRSTVLKFWKDSAIWIRLMAIFSLIWIGSFTLTQEKNVFAVFFDWPIAARLPAMIVLSLASSITDNVALAAMQAALILKHPLPVWMIRLVFILLTWAGGLTSFGCLQSLALHSRAPLPLSMRDWLREAWKWAAITLVAGLIGLVAIILMFPSDLAPPPGAR